MLSAHLAAASPLEQGAFMLVRASRGVDGVRLIGSALILPEGDSWECQGDDVLRPSAVWLSAAISRAIANKAGLLFIHSHPRSEHPPGFSKVDTSAFEDLAQTIAPMLEGPFAAAVVHETGWAGAVWEGTSRTIERIVSVGLSIRELTPVAPVATTSLDARQRDALGIAHDRLRSLTVGVAGCGGLGSPIAEILLRAGVAEVILIDHDALDTDSNIRRVFGSTIADLGATIAPPKVDVVGRHLDQLGLTTKVTRVNADVRSREAVRRLLDADVIVCATDTHGSRATVNDVAVANLIPLIDVGVRVGTRGIALSGLAAEVRLVTPARPCLWCRGAINSDRIRAENLPADERRTLQDEGYVVDGIGEPVPSVVALTVLGAGMATSALLSLLSEDGDVIPSGYWLDGMFGDARETEPREPIDGCRCRSLLGQANEAPIPLM
jgi:molybdopterin-synthase adenylyltransferase